MLDPVLARIALRPLGLNVSGWPIFITQSINLVLLFEDFQFPHLLKSNFVSIE